MLVVFGRRYEWKENGQGVFRGTVERNVIQGHGTCEWTDAAGVRCVYEGDFVRGLMQARPSPPPPPPSY